ncbi:MAG: hypothetical protein IT222_00175 [Crocinitomix sp.]|nr:hypothetical protein [Crocinitomix sp.]
MNKYILIGFYCLLAFSVFGQEGGDIYDHGLDRNKWQDIRKGIRYEGQKEGAGRPWTYESDEEYQREQRKFSDGNGSGGGNGAGTGGGQSGSSERPVEIQETPDPPVNFDPPNLQGLGMIGYVLIGVFIVMILFLLYKLFVNAESRGKKIIPQNINLDTDNPSEIPLTELERMLRDALSNKDYRLAVRIYFIFIVRDLAQKNWIKWEKDKTNLHYLQEMSSQNEYQDFSTAVNYFEVIWYGKREIDEPKFESIRPKFTRLLDKLGIK